MIPNLRTTSSKSYNSIVGAFNRELKEKAEEINILVESAKYSGNATYLKVNRLGKRVDELEVYVNSLDEVIKQWEE